VGLLMNWMGLNMVLAPLTLLLDCIPFVGPFVADLIDTGRGVVTFVMSAVLTLLTIAIAWIAVSC
jgi:hypothetical protein